MSDQQLKDNEYRCGVCNKVYEYPPEWPKEKAMEELKQFPNPELMVIMCDECIEYEKQKLN